MTIPQYSVYSASKRALLGFSLTARAELAKDRIVVSEILYLARIKSAVEINDIRKSRPTCYMDEIKRVRSYGEGQPPILTRHTHKTGLLA